MGKRIKDIHIDSADEVVTIAVTKVGRATTALVSFGDLIGTGAACRRLEDPDNRNLAADIATRRALEDLVAQLGTHINKEMRRNCGGTR